MGKTESTGESPYCQRCGFFHQEVNERVCYSCRAEIGAEIESAKTSESAVDVWIEKTLWSRWGWAGWAGDDLLLPYRDEKEKNRIQSAVEFIVRALGNNNGADTQRVVDLIVIKRRGPKHD